MSDFVEVEWFGREDKIGIVLTYDQHDGFKARMAPLESNKLSSLGDEEADIKYLMREAAKIPFEWAWGIFKERMLAEWVSRHLPNIDATKIRYDSRDYSVATLQEVKS